MLAEKHGHEMHAELDSAWQAMHNSTNSVASATEGSPVHSINNGTASA